MKQLISSWSQFHKNKAFLDGISDKLAHVKETNTEYYYIPLRPVKIRKRTIKTVDFSAKVMERYFEKKQEIEDQRKQYEIKKQDLFNKLKDI